MFSASIRPRADLSLINIEPLEISKRNGKTGKGYDNSQKRNY